MKTNQPVPPKLDNFDAVAEPDDQFQVEVLRSPTGKTIYVHVNGQTVVRIGHIKTEVEVTIPGYRKGVV